jgi:hypothetical protein
MSEELFDIANRFLADQICTKQELTRFKSWLSDPVTQPEVEKWLFEHWSTSTEVDSNAMLELVFKQIQDEEMFVEGKSLRLRTSVYKNNVDFEPEFNVSWKRRNKLLKQPSYFIGKRVLKYAAILIIAISIGTAGFWSFYQNQKSYVYSTITESGKNSKSQLHLSNGTIVDLEKDNSKIALSGDQVITIDNEKVIDLNKTSHADDSKMNEVAVPFGKKSQLTLEDGTKVWLNAGSRMAFPTKFKGNKREVFLEGEGYFEVAHNQKLPFFVNTAEIAIKVLGTKFDISAYRSDKLIETVLIEGKVSISEQSTLAFIKNESILMPNQKASFDRNDRSIVVKDEPNVDYAIAWTKECFKFYRQSINDVLNKLQRYYNVQFILSPGFHTENLITGELYLKDSIEQIMKSLDVVVGLQYRIVGNQIYIGKKTNEIPMKN